MQILTRLNKVIAYSEHGFIPVGNSAICAASRTCHDDVLITTVECIPTDIDRYNYYYIDGKFVKEGSSCVIKEVNNYSELRFWAGTRDEYMALPDKEKINLYAIITDGPSTSYSPYLDTPGYYYISLQLGSTSYQYDVVCSIGLVYWEGGELQTLLPSFKVGGYTYTCQIYGNQLSCECRDPDGNIVYPYIATWQVRKF